MKQFLCSASPGSLRRDSCNASERFDAQGNLTDNASIEFIRQLLQNLAEWTRRIS
jgi:hypothetical protein